MQQQMIGGHFQFAAHFFSGIFAWSTDEILFEQEQLTFAETNAINDKFCFDCKMMNGHALTATQLSGVICPKNRLSNMTGEHGGGAASCGQEVEVVPDLEFTTFILV
uniref:Uncharacterized protein n=1 Tax=Ditylenchus dipsaci TaxID=166011 RepID=A0A915CQV2_9BILA